MKKLILILLLFASCKKDNCQTCQWTRKINSGLVTITVKEEKICSDDEIKSVNGKSQYIYDSSGNRVYAKCDCK